MSPAAGATSLPEYPSAKEHVASIVGDVLL